MLRVGLVSTFDSRRTAEFPARHSLSAMRLGAFLVSRKPDWYVRMRAFDQSTLPAAAAEALMGDRFDVIGLPAYIWTKAWSRDLSMELLSRKNPLIVVGGPETQTMSVDDWPEDVLFVVGPGEEAFLAVCEGHETCSPVSESVHASLAKFPVYSRGSGRAAALVSARPDKSMLRLPHGAPLFGAEFFGLLDGGETQPDFSWYETARGCIYSCSFCGHNTLPFFATYDLEFVEQEIMLMQRCGVRRIFLIDPILGGRPARGKAILRLFKAVAPEISITAYMRPEFLDDEFITLLAQSNIEELLVGIQTVNPSVPRHVRGNDIPKMVRYLPELAARGVRWRAELIVGLPGDTKIGLEETLRFTVNMLKPATLFAYPLTAIPGTELFGLVKNYSNANWIEIDDHSRVISSSTFSAEGLLSMQRYSGAISALYNQLKANGINCLPFDELERRATSELSPKSASRFAELNSTLPAIGGASLGETPGTMRWEGAT